MKLDDNIYLLTVHALPMYMLEGVKVKNYKNFGDNTHAYVTKPLKCKGKFIDFGGNAAGICQVDRLEDLFIPRKQSRGTKK